tara:strand:+ start:384 stop:563 length:180 start_codon:yes stop_codon:yes gene_type:complete
VYHIIYIPKIEDEVVVAKFETEAEAIKFMDRIKLENPKAHQHHYIKNGVDVHYVRSEER